MKENILLNFNKMSDIPIWSIGRRCNSTQFLKQYNIFTKDTPWDWAVCDIETIVVNINTDFQDFLCDLYSPITDKVINPRNFLSKPNPKINKVKYLDLKFGENNNRNIVLNLNMIDRGETRQYNLYDLYNQKGLFFFHYDMEKAENHAKLQHRIDRFRELGEENVLFYIAKTVSSEQLQSEKSRITNIISGCVKKYKWAIMVPLENMKENRMENIEKTRKEDVTINGIAGKNISVRFIYISVPPLSVQLGSNCYGLRNRPIPGNDNNVNDTRIDWSSVVALLKDFSEKLPQ